MKIVIVGAAGNVGSRTVDTALDAGHDVVAYLRRPERIRPRDGLTIVGGDAADADALAAAMRSADAVVVAITGSMRDTSFMQRTIPSIIEAVAHAPGIRLIVVSAFGAGDTAIKASPLPRLIYRTALSGFFRDKAAADDIVRSSSADWTIVYPVNLKDAPTLPTHAVERMERVRSVPGMPTLPFGNVAKALVQIAEDASFSCSNVLVTTSKGWTAQT